jgi:hypothetical protein
MIAVELAYFYSYHYTPLPTEQGIIAKEQGNLPGKFEITA